MQEKIPVRNCIQCKLQAFNLLWNFHICKLLLIIFFNYGNCERFHLKLFLKYEIFHLEFFFRYADQLSIGDEVLIETSKTLIPAKVINVSNSLMQGN